MAIVQQKAPFVRIPVILTAEAQARGWQVLDMQITPSKQAFSTLPAQTKVACTCRTANGKRVTLGFNYSKSHYYESYD